MSGGAEAVSSKTGLARHFDTLTTVGRRNCTLASYAFYFAVYCIYKMSSSKKQKA